jgi:hypothetical protein
LIRAETIKKPHASISKAARAVRAEHGLALPLTMPREVEGGPKILALRDAGIAKAARFTRERTKTTLQQVYRALQSAAG